jgi:ubiquinol-cytochrome c reductase cytochrome b subunit
MNGRMNGQMNGQMNGRARPPGRVEAWLEDRLGLSEIGRLVAGGSVPGGASLWHALGSVAALLVVLEVLTGILLAAFYAPSVTDAWASVAYIQDQVTLGWFVRGLHSFGSTALIVVTGLHLLQVLLFGAYKAPREANWIVGLGLLGAVAAFALTGYLLPWDQKGYWAKLVEATIMGRTPIIGRQLQELVQGGSAFGNITLAHVFAAHTYVLPLALSILLVVHIYAFRRHGYTPKWNLAPAALARRTVPFWPDQAARNAMAAAFAFALVVIAVVSRHGAELESPADPGSSYLARPEWYALPLFQLRMYFEGSLEIIATMVIPGLVTGLLVALPFIDRSASRAPGSRPLVMVGTIAGVVALGLLSAAAVRKDARDPAYARARAAEREKAATARRLAREGAPPEGGVAIFRNDPLYEAREIWDEKCAGCHGLGGEGGDKGPDLKGYGTRGWIAGFLANPDGPLYMGPAKVEKGMKPVDGTPEELAALTELVYAEGGARDADAALVERGKALFPDKDCDSCHDLDEGSENDGPNLKGRGTEKWVADVIADASAGHLFGKKNKMPKFSDKLTGAQIDLLARFVLAQKELAP